VTVGDGKAKRVRNKPTKKILRQNDWLNSNEVLVLTTIRIRLSIEQRQMGLIIYKETTVTKPDIIVTLKTIQTLFILCPFPTKVIQILLDALILKPLRL